MAFEQLPIFRSQIKIMPYPFVPTPFMVPLLNGPSKGPSKKFFKGSLKEHFKEPLKGLLKGYLKGFF